MKDEAFDLNTVLEAEHWWFKARRDLVMQVLKVIHKPGDGETLLDLGCGTGLNVAEFNKQWKAIGVDTSEYALNYAREKYPDCDYQKMDIFESPDSFW